MPLSMSSACALSYPLPVTLPPLCVLALPRALISGPVSPRPYSTPSSTTYSCANPLVVILLCPLIGLTSIKFSCHLLPPVYSYHAAHCFIRSTVFRVRSPLSDPVAHSLCSAALFPLLYNLFVPTH